MKKMEYNIGETYLLNRDYSTLVENEEVEIVDRHKKGRKAALDVKNSEGKVFERVSFRYLKKKKNNRR